MKKRFLALLILVLCAQVAYGAAGDVASVNWKAITAAASVGGKANTAILTIGGKPCSDGDGGTDTVGYNAIGGSSYGQAAGSIRCYAKFTAAHTGNITSVEMYSSATEATSDMKIGLYTDNSGSPNSPVQAPTEVSNIGTWTTGWHSFTGLSIPVTASSVYWICAEFSEGLAALYYDSAGTNSYAIDAHTYANAWPDPMGEDELNGNQYSVRGTVTY